MNKILAAVVAIIAMLGPDSAATISHEEAQKRVADFQTVRAALLAKFPPFAAIDVALKADCAARVSGQTQSGAFCDCASAVTLALWYSGMDPKMKKRLDDYGANPNGIDASDFLKYQGPELYRPLCSLAVAQQN